MNHRPHHRPVSPLRSSLPAGSPGRYSRPAVAVLPWVVVLLLLLDLAAAGPAWGEETVIFAFGDSITEGWNGDTHSDEEGGYVRILDELLNARVEESVVYNFGVGGQTTGEGLARLPYVLDLMGDQILIMFGTNDISRGISINTALFNLDQMLGMSLEDEMLPMISTIIPRLEDPRDPDNALARQLNAGIAQLAQQDGVEFCDNWEAFTDWPGGYRVLLSDMLHPNALGYQVMAETWLGALARLKPPPWVVSISPTGMENGFPRPVGVTGGNFLPGALLRLDQIQLEDVSVTSTGALRATVPAELAPGVYDVVVVNPGEVTATLADGFTITNSPPEIYSIAPDTLEAGHRFRVDVSGRFIEPGAELGAGVFDFDQVFVLGDTGVRALTPDGISVGVYDIRLTNPDGQVALLEDAFTVVDSGMPEIGNRYPAPLSTGASPHTAVRFNLRDRGSGIDIGSLSMVVDGAAVIPIITGAPGDYFLEYRPASPWPHGRTVTVSVGISDFNQPAPNSLSVFYSFTVSGAADSDLDGLPDDWELAHDLDPGSTLGDEGATGDADRDRQTNTDEYLGGTDPTSPCQVVTGPGPGRGNRPLIRLWDTSGVQLAGVEWLAYGGSDWGADVAAGDIDGDGRSEVITGPGPGETYGPQVRAFEAEGTTVPGISFFAYGTHRYGVRVTAGDLDGDGIDEIVTGAGPGEVFGPHVRAFSYDGASVSPVPGVSFFAYGTHKYGVNVACGDLDGDGMDEIITGAGPGEVFGAHVRGWNVDGGAAAPISGVSFFAFATPKYGVSVGCGDLDGDRRAEIITGPGPGSAFAAQVRGWKLEQGTVAEIPGMDFFAYDRFVFAYGARVAAGHFYY